MSTKRLTPTKDTLIRLFAKSGNRCAFKGCSNLLFTDKNIFIGQVCHIKAVSVNGERFDNNLTAEDLRKPENLMLLCYEHHVEIDRGITKYSPADLLEIKREHEQQFEDVTQDLTNEQAEQMMQSYLTTLDSKLDSIITQNSKNAHLKEGIKYEVDPLSVRKWNNQSVLRNALIGSLSFIFGLLAFCLGLFEDLNIFVSFIIYGVLFLIALTCSPMIFAPTWNRNKEVDFLGTFYKLNNELELTSYQKHAKCSFPDCDGWIKIVDPPEKEVNRHKKIGCCSKEPRLHTYSCENNNTIGYFHKMDFSKKDPKPSN